MSREKRRAGESVVPQPVKKIEITEDKKKLRVVLALLFGTLGVGLLTYAVASFFSAEEGWQTIETNISYGVTCGSDFTFQYYLGGEGVSATAQKKQLVKIYSQASAMAHQMFHETEQFPGVANVAYINAHPGEVIQIDEGLYHAFETYLENGCRNLYLGPVYDQYRNFFSADVGTEEFDPIQSKEMDIYFREILAYANDPAHVNLDLLGDNKVRLTLSEECKEYALDNEIINWIDFYWAKNAFIVDYLAEKITMEGYTLGRITSVDGYARMLSANDSNQITLYNREDMNVCMVGTLKVDGAVSVVVLHDYPLGEADSCFYGERKDGSLVSAYIDTADGRDRTFTDTICFTSDKKGCGEIISNVIPLYISEEENTSALQKLAGEDIFYIFYDNGTFYSNHQEGSFNQRSGKN